VSIATAMVFCHRFYLRQSHAKNDRRVSVTQWLLSFFAEFPLSFEGAIKFSKQMICLFHFVCQMTINRIFMLDKRLKNSNVYIPFLC
jgi:hypothetical protein